MRFPFKLGPRGLILLTIILVVVLILVGWTILAFNGLVAKRTSAEAQWAQVENQYQRKIDLIPELVSVTSQYTEFEKGVLENITMLRTRWMNASTIPQQINVSNLMDLQVISLVSTYENYPYLHSISLVAGLFNELAGTENRIAVERMRYNDNVRAYNTSLNSFPDGMIGGMFGFQEMRYYDPIPGGP